jgi:hypothetical protein
MSLKMRVGLAVAGLGMALMTTACVGMVEESGVAFLQATRDADVVASQPVESPALVAPADR